MLYSEASEKTGPEHMHSGFFACLMAFFLLFSTPGKTLANDDNAPSIPWSIHQFTSDFAAGNKAFKTIAKIWLPYDQKLLLSGSIYKQQTRKYYFLPPLPTSLEINKRASLTDFGVIGMINWPMITWDSWSFDFNGRISGAQHYFGPAYQKTRWNFEHQLGWDVNYRLTDSVRSSLGFYNYRIINNFQPDNPAQSYISSNGGFASLIMQF